MTNLQAGIERKAPEPEFRHKKERIEEVTLLRAFAFLAVTLQHCIAEYIYRPDILQSDSIMLAMLFHFTRFGTPTFVFLSGLILFYNYSGKLHYRSFIRKRFGDIFVPFLCWTIIYWIAVEGVIGGKLMQPSAWLNIFLQLIKPTNGYHLWFILMIFQFYLLFPLFSRAVAAFRDRLHPDTEGKLIRRVAWASLTLSLMYGALMWLSYYKMPGWAASAGGFWAGLITFRSNYFIMYTFYFLIGSVCAFGLSRFRTFVADAMGWTMIVFIGAYIWLGYDVLRFSAERMNLQVSNYLKPSTFVIIVSQLLLLYGFALLLQRRKGAIYRILRFIGRYSFGGFLAHAFVLMLVSGVTRPMHLTGSHLPAALITFILVAAGAIGLSSLLEKLPFGRWLVGPTGRRRAGAAYAGRSVAERAVREQTG
ncbi:acyltransferase [Paenibacillus prosopidis]|uniref:Surface polysaccharide O-acyltransferase-like enzyme n=1 Tax=Paenibacillus prosopidis TaxID=630520 RepID=A0A368VVQ8_9BACL|nr:acyltransferase [Paenibacillus prosopidis]RCW45420.1 surface polysaccharide O-acyltransferase-like enzyme [Paenibacillus prosopidis]